MDDAQSRIPPFADQPLEHCLEGVTATAVHLLADRGVLQYGMSVAAVWPGFAAHGKDGVTLRQVLNHSAGVPHLPGDTTPADLCDWDRMCAVIAASSPLWEAGTRVHELRTALGIPIPV